MKVNNDGKLDIAIGYGKDSKVWKNKSMEWSAFLEKLQTPVRSEVTLKEYHSASREDKSTIKNHGAYVGGYLRNGRRLKSHVMHRQLLTLDLDFAVNNVWDSVRRNLPHSAVMHSTFSHTDESPRFRLILPLTREISVEEYYAVSRAIAGKIDIEQFDDTTFDVNRLMYFPSCPKDKEFIFYHQDLPWIDPDNILEEYKNWRDVSEWPVSSRVSELIHSDVKKQQDPLEKKGIIGAWCRTFTIQEVIEEFLPEIYTPGIDGRYTYANGTTSSGLVVYEDKFSYSHHGTDPASGKLCNAFDLVRIHRFGHLDSGRSDDTTSSKSYLAMEEFCLSIPSVKLLLTKEQVDNVKSDFEESLEDDTESDKQWLSELELDGKGKITSSAFNISLILHKDPNLKDKLRMNLFDNRPYIFGPLPWREDVPAHGEPMKNVDLAGVRNYLETTFNITGLQKIDDCINLELERNSFHPVRNYLNSLVWDGKPRVDNLLIRCFGVSNTLYNREAIRKPLVAAVARIYEPGTKFDLVLTLVGAEGTGKSTFFKKLGRQWFSDTFMTVNGKEALEQIHGAWLIEMAELAGLRKAEVESIKHFITKQEDMFRPAYGRTVETYKRQCIFFGTTNNRDFLKDPTGNRRFVPVSVSNHCAGGWTPGLDGDIDQIWAEAVYLYRKGENLYLSSEANKTADFERKAHTESDSRTGLIREFLNMSLPRNWEEMDLFERREYISDPLSPKTGINERDIVCTAEIWCECLGKEKADLNRYNTREVNEILRSLPDWEPSGTTKRFKIYGTQNFFQRKLD